MALAPLSPALAAPSPRNVSVDDLKKALTLYHSISRLDVDFQQTKTLKDMDLKLKSEGHLTLSLPQRVEWKILKPTPLTVELEKDKITIHSGSGTQVFSQAENPSAKDRESFQTLLTWLKLDAEEINRKYDVTLTGPGQYRFTSKNPDEPVMKSLEMKLSKAGHVQELRFHEASGDQVQIRFAKPKVTYRRTR
jgi:hypothetical protein